MLELVQPSHQHLSNIQESTPLFIINQDQLTLSDPQKQNVVKLKI